MLRVSERVYGRIEMLIYGGFRGGIDGGEGEKGESLVRVCVSAVVYVVVGIGFRRFIRGV